MITISFAAPLTPDALMFLSERTDIDFTHQDMRDWFCVTAYNEDDAIVGVVACEPKTWFDWYFNSAVSDPRCVTRRLLRTIFKTLFSRAVRITAEVSPGNGRAVSIIRRMGFIYEGFKRMGVEGRRDALMFGMLREDCRFLPGYAPTTPPPHPIILGGPPHGLQS